MGKIGERIDQFKKTFGIEIEFCSHDSDILSFTHLEVCTIIHGGFEWKIETDADYTLELVSPIVIFKDHEEANKFKELLMVELDQIVREEPTLDRCVAKISDILEFYKITYYDPKIGVASTKVVKSNTVAQIKYISKDDLLKELDFHNWDADTNLERVINLKKKIDQSSFNDAKVEELLKAVILSPSKKHGGLPSSQLNHPISLRNYVWYLINAKEPKAWLRLLSSSQDDFSSDWRHRKAYALLQKYKHLKKNETWRRRYLNDDYMGKQQNERITIWHKYWFWLVSIQEITNKALGIEPIQRLEELKNLIMDENSLNSSISHNNYDRFRETTVKLLNEKKKETNLEQSIDIIQIFIPSAPSPLPFENRLPKKKMINIISTPKTKIPGEETTRRSEDFDSLQSALYVTIHKLISGALGVLSETEQGKLQKMIMEMEGELEDEDVLKSCVKNPEFLEFHYALKDLTPLWFKGALGDVLLNLPDKGDWQKLEGYLEKLTGDDVEQILNDNLKFLGRLYTLNEYFHHGNPYDWDEFKEELMPSVSGFVRQFEKGKLALLKAFGDDSIKNGSYTYAALNVDEKTKNNKFLDRKEVPPWEGRWDTMKPSMPNENDIEFLIEHRNN